MSGCYFCDEDGITERHHIVPRRFGGSDKDENLVDVCPTCHRKLESLYDKRFYNALNVKKPDGKRRPPMCESCNDHRSVGQVLSGMGGLRSWFTCEECAEEGNWRIQARFD